MDDADRVCRLPDDDWQDYDTTYASEIKTRKEGLLLSYCCKRCNTIILLIDQPVEDLPLRKLDRCRVVDALYNANKLTNFLTEGYGPGGKPMLSKMDAEHVMRYPPFKVKINEGCYERRFRLVCSTCGKAFGYRVVTEDSQLAKFNKARTYNYEPFERLTYISPKYIELVNKESERAKEFIVNKQTTDRGKTATTTVSTVEKDEQDVEQHQILESYHKNIAIMKNELQKRGAIKRKMAGGGEEPEYRDPGIDEVLAMTGGKTARRGDGTQRRGGTLGIDAVNL